MSTAETGPSRSKKYGSTSLPIAEVHSTNTSGSSAEERMRLTASRAPRESVDMISPPISSG